MEPATVIPHKGRLWPRLCIMLLLLLTTVGASAYNVSGVVTDSQGEPLAQAAVKLLTARDSSLVKGVLADLQGRFNITGIKTGKYIIEASYVGMTTLKKEISVAQSNLQTDTLRLLDGGISLSDVEVRGIRTPVKVMEDTVEYAADAFKTQPNAVVEDLLKRLPGVEVGSDGAITANGKTVSKILVDGEEFFANDPKVASKNLPVSMVDKLQVVDRKSDLARLTGVDDGEDETVINLTVKKGMNNGWFGTVGAGYGTDQRYKGNFNINRFWNGNQITLLGNINNINEEGFTDENGNRFRRFGGSSGINTTRALGLNFNVGNAKIFRVGGSVEYNNNDRHSVTSVERQYLFKDSTSYYRSFNNSRDRGHNFRTNLRMQWNPDSFNTIEVRPSLTWNYNNSTGNDSSLTRDGHMANVNRSVNLNHSDGHSLELGAQLIYNHKFRSHPGRSFSVMLNARHSKVNEDQTSYSHNFFWKRLPELLNDSINLYDQLLDRINEGTNLGGRLSWTEPLGNLAGGNFLTISYNVSYRRNSSDKMVYDHPVTWPDGFSGDPVIDYLTTVWNDTLSNQFRNDYLNQDLRVGYKKVTSKANLDAGLSVVPQRSESEDLVNSARNIPVRWVWNYAPFLRYRHRFTKQRSLMVNYRGRSSQPSMTQLQPVPDMSNPLNIVIGNPDLDPSFSHSMNVRFQDFNPESMRSIMTMADVSMTQNSITAKITHNPVTGGQTTTYTNVNGNWSARLMGMYTQPLRNKNWRISNNIFFNYQQQVGFNNGLRNRSGDIMVSESFGIAFRPDNLELELRPRYSFRHSMNSVQTIKTKDIHNYGGTFTATYYTPINVVLSSDLNYTGSIGQAAGYNRNDWMWNASISYQALHDKSLVFSVTAYDLLQQQRNTSYSVNPNYISDSRFNTLTRYFMATVTYKFNSFGKGKTPTAIGDEDRGPGPRGGHGGPPPGGRPGGGFGGGRGPGF